MNRNQLHAVEVATAVLQARVAPDDLPDRDWELLLLASGFKCVSAPPEAVARQVLADAEAAQGYFALPPTGHAGEGRARATHHVGPRPGSGEPDRGSALVRAAGVEVMILPVR